MTLKEYTNSRRLSYQRVYHYAVVSGKENGYTDHIRKEKGTLVLDDEAVIMLDNYFKKKEAKEAVILNRELLPDNSGKKTVRVKTVMLSDLNEKEERFKELETELEKQKAKLAGTVIELSQTKSQLIKCQGEINSLKKQISEEKTKCKAAENKLKSYLEKQKAESKNRETPDGKKWVTIAEYAESEKISYEAARKKVEMYAEELGEHIKEVPYGKGKRTKRMLDEDACSMLSNHTAGGEIKLSNNRLALRKFELETLLCYAIFNRDKDSIRALVNWVMEQIVQESLPETKPITSMVTPVTKIEKKEKEVDGHSMSDNEQDNSMLPFEIIM